MYSMLREFADSWMLLAMLVMFVGFVAYVFRPGGREANKRAKNSIFIEDETHKDEADG